MRQSLRDVHIFSLGFLVAYFVFRGFWVRLREAKGERNRESPGAQVKN